VISSEYNDMGSHCIYGWAVGQLVLEFTLAKSSLGVNSKQLVKSIIMSLGEHHKNTSDNQNAYDIPFRR